MTSSPLPLAERTVYLKGMHLAGTPVDFQQAHKLLKSSFSQKGITDIDIVRFKDRKSPNGDISFYAYVTFQSTLSASKALSLGSITIEGKQIQVQRRTPEKEFQLYIKNVGTLDEQTLTSFFGKYGKVSEIQLYQDFHGVTTGLIKFENQVEAEQFLKGEEWKIEGVQVKIEKFIPKDERREEGNRQLFLKKIPLCREKTIMQQEQELLKQFEQFGVITKRIEIEVKDGAKTGTAIILYENSKSLDVARENFNTNLFGNNYNKMELDYYLTKKDREQAGIIYLSNVKPDVNIKELIALFSTFGKIDASSFNRTSSRGEEMQRGTITFETKETMIEALAEWGILPNIRSYFIGNKPIINIYQDRSERNEFMRTQKPIRPQQQQFPVNTGFQGGLPMMRPGFGLPMPMVPMMGGFGMPTFPPRLATSLPNNPLSTTIPNPFGNTIPGNPSVITK